VEKRGKGNARAADEQSSGEEEKTEKGGEEARPALSSSGHCAVTGTTGGRREAFPFKGGDSSEGLHSFLPSITALYQCSPRRDEGGPRPPPPPSSSTARSAAFCTKTLTARGRRLYSWEGALHEEGRTTRDSPLRTLFYH